MDELGRVIAQILQNTPQEGAESAPQQAPPAPPPPPPAAGSGGPGGGPPASGIAALLPALGGGDLAGLLGGGGGLPHSHRLDLLIALKPWLRPARAAEVDRLCRMVSTAYGVRGALRSLGGVLNV